MFLCVCSVLEANGHCECALAHCGGARQWPRACCACAKFTPGGSCASRPSAWRWNWHCAHTAVRSHGPTLGLHPSRHVHAHFISWQWPVVLSRHSCVGAPGSGARLGHPPVSGCLGKAGPCTGGYPSGYPYRIRTRTAVARMCMRMLPLLALGYCKAQRNPGPQWKCRGSFQMQPLGGLATGVQTL